MSLPTFPQIDPPLTREGSLNEIISSIAAEELSLSHILNAEGEMSWAPCLAWKRLRFWRRSCRSTRACRRPCLT